MLNEIDTDVERISCCRSDCIRHGSRVDTSADLSTKQEGDAVVNRFLYLDSQAIVWQKLQGCPQTFHTCCRRGGASCRIERPINRDISSRALLTLHQLMTDLSCVLDQGFAYIWRDIC